jgi:hypothetical protein
VYSIGSLPNHVPCVALSVWPSSAVPAIVGAETSAGGEATTTELASELFDAEPAELVQEPDGKESPQFAKRPS